MQIRENYENWLGRIKGDRDFEKSYVVGSLAPWRAIALRQEIEEQFVPTRFLLESFVPSYFAVQFEKALEKRLADCLSFYTPAKPSKLLEKVLSEIGFFAEEKLGHPVCVVNVRIWTIRINADTTMGPNAWHTDGMPPGIYKVMYYLSAPSLENGTTEIELPSKRKLCVNGVEGTVLLFDNSNLLHRGLPPRSAQAPDRMVMEVTIIPGRVSSFTPVFAGTNAQYPKVPWLIESQDPCLTY